MRAQIAKRKQIQALANRYFESFRDRQRLIVRSQAIHTRLANDDDDERTRVRRLESNEGASGEDVAATLPILAGLRFPTRS